MSRDYDFQESEFAVAVAGAAFAIRSFEEEEEEVHYRSKKGDFGKSKTKIKTTKEDATDGSVRITRSFSKEMKDTGETSIGKTTRQDHREQEAAFPVRKPSRLSSIRLKKPADQTRIGDSTSIDVKESKVEAWEKAQLRKINKRYEKMKSKILEWENAKKMKAKLNMEKKKNELELRRTRNFQRYQNSLSRIDMVAGGARAQLEEKRRNEESEVKDKAKYMRSKRRSPAKCFCF